MRRFVPVLALCLLLAAPVAGQLTASGAVLATAASSDHFYRDRVVLGVRYRPQLVGPLALQLGVMLAGDNALFPSKSGIDTRHWAAGLEVQALTLAEGAVRFGVIHGRLIEERTDERPHAGLPDITYYQFWALSSEMRLTTEDGPLTVSVEQLLYVPQSVSLANNRTIIRGRAPGIDVLWRRLEQARNQVPYEFWTGAIRVQPFQWVRMGSRWRRLAALAIEAGSRPVLRYDQDASIPLRYLAVGLAFGVTR